LIAALFAIALTGLSAAAAEPWPARVGRISLAETGATLRPAGGAWGDAVVNEPVAAGSSIRSGAQGRAEITLSGITIALAPGTTLDIGRLDKDAAQFALSSGRATLALDRRNPAAVEIATAAGPVKPTAPGRYDIDAAAGLTEKSEATGAVVLPEQVPATMPGAAALATGGTWGRSDGGPIWYPNGLPAGWAPFRDGGWRNLPPWGWTWIDDASWGFAPSHYGRWARVDNRWGWVPGSAEVAADFMPAGVAFLGTPGIGLSYAGGSGPAIAWFPLAPGEPYWPAADGDAPAKIVDAAYKNRRFASAVPKPVFIGGKPVAAALVDIPDRRLDVAPVIPGSPGLKPPAPRLVAGLPRITVHPAPPILAAAPPKPKPAPARIALDAPHRRTANHRPPPKLAAAPPPHPDKMRRHIAEAHHILRQ
jgi:hypothetical protein